MRISTLLATSLCAGSLVVSQSAIAAPALANSSTNGKASFTAASPQDVVTFGVYLPLRNTNKLENLLAKLHDPNSPQYRQWLQPADFLAQFGPRQSDLDAVKSALIARGMTIVSSNAHGMRVQGSAAAVSQAFSAPLQKVTRQSHTHFQARQALHNPAELASIDMRIVGLTPVPEHHVNAYIRATAPLAITDNRRSPTGLYWFTDLKQAYDYPAWSPQTDGSGVSVAVLMSDQVYPGDVQAVFDHEKFTAITGKPAPSVSTVLVDGGGVQNGNGSVEASLDVQQVLGGAPGSNVTLVSLPDLSDQSIMDGYQYIIDSNKYDIVNSSFGACELAYTTAYNGGTDYTSVLQAEHEMFLQGNAQGISFVASAGDEAGLECPSVDYVNGGTSPTFIPSVSTPAADPAVTAVGGGNLVTASAPPSLDSTYVRESAYSDPEVPYDPWGLGVNVSGGAWGAGGGVSTIYPKPDYQSLANTGSNNWRTVPDVGMQVGGCPSGLSQSCGADDSGVVIAFGVGAGGGYYGVIGTSVSSPEFVGALAVFEQQLGKKNHRVGNANYYLYASGALQTRTGGIHAPTPMQMFHRNNPGYNGVVPDSFPSYDYNYVYGNGTPDVRKLFHMIQYQSAGVPQTATNP